MLDFISNRLHKKPLHVIIIGEPNHVVRFRLAFPSHELLRITLLEKDLVASILGVVVVANNCDIKINAKVMKELQQHGLIPL